MSKSYTAVGFGILQPKAQFLSENSIYALYSWPFEANVLKTAFEMNLQIKSLAMHEKAE
jgi:hypothetical protein